MIYCKDCKHAGVNYVSCEHPENVYTAVEQHSGVRKEVRRISASWSNQHNDCEWFEEGRNLSSMIGFFLGDG